MKPLPIAVLAALLGSLVLGSLVFGSLVLGVPAASAATPSPTVLSARATPSAFGPAGGQVLVSGTVKNANTCQLVLLSRQSFPVVYSHNPTTACQEREPTRLTSRSGPTRAPAKRTVAFALVARNGTYSSSGRFYVVARAPVGPHRPVGPRHPERSGAGRRPGPGERYGQQRQHLPARAAVAPVLPRRLLAQPDDRVPERQLLGPRQHRGQPERRSKRTVAFALVARNGAYSFDGRFYVSLAPLLVPTVLSARATPSALGPAGGQVLVSGTVKNANTCQLVLLSRQSFPVVYSHNPTTACRSGSLLGPRHHRGQPERR